MNYTITSGQIAFFKKYGYLALEGLLTAEELSQLEKGVKPGFDLWRHNAFLKNLVQGKKILKVASLLSPRPLRLLNDYAFFADKKIEPPFLPKQTLQDRSCLTEVSLGVLITLKDGKTLIGEKENKAPLTRGSFVFINGSHPFPFEELLTEENASFYLVCYGNEKALFVCNPSDPYTTQMKKWGYSYGDRLKEETHPMVYWN
jgi:hypothetical protein